MAAVGNQAAATVARAASQKLIARRLYRNLLRTAAPFAAPSPNATVLSCLLQRTGIDDYTVHDWELYDANDKMITDKDDHDGDDDITSSTTVVSTEDQARDLTYSYADRIQQQQQQQQQQTPEGVPRTNRDPNNPRTYQDLFRRLLREVVTGKNGFAKMTVPSKVDPTRLRKVIQREFRNGPDSISSSKLFDDATRLQTALTAIRELNKKLAFYSRLQDMAPAPNPDQAAWNVSPLLSTTESESTPALSYLKAGTFLVSHPYMNDPFFSKSVICILDHSSIHDLPGDDDEAENDDDDVSSSSTTKGSYQIPGETYGLIINRESIRHETGKNRTLKEAFQENMLPERISEIFGDSVVRNGGPVHASLQMIYSISSSSEQDEDVASTVGGRLIPAIEDDEEERQSSAMYSDRATYFQGQIFKAASAIENGELDRDDVSFF
ncbi:MAG: hypothetical protein SGARI_002279, partial [Bacillariaceae sp.]